MPRWAVDSQLPEGPRLDTTPRHRHDTIAHQQSSVIHQRISHHLSAVPRSLPPATEIPLSQQHLNDRRLPAPAQSPGAVCALRWAAIRTNALSAARATASCARISMRRGKGDYWESTALQSSTVIPLHVLRHSARLSSAPGSTRRVLTSIIS